MNEFLEQFLMESRALVEQATDDLLALEDRPADRDRLDGAFRAFHTLKGAAGIMEFEPMVRALHAAEDVLSATRAGASPVSTGLISDCLTSLDQVQQWLDAITESGAFPSDADRAAAAIVKRFEANSEGTAEPDPSTGWVEALVGRHPGIAGAAAAVRYSPPPDAFFSGEDALASFRVLPGMLALHIQPAKRWPGLGEFDPYLAQITIEALFTAAAATLTEQLAGLKGEVEIVDLAASPAPQDATLPPLCGELLRAQILMLEAPVEDGLQGRSASAARVAANVLRGAGRLDQAERMEELERPLGARATILDALRGVLAGAWEPSPAEPFGEPERDIRTSSEPAARSLRVDVERVDALVNLTGELTVAKNAMAHTVALAESGADLPGLSRLLKGQHAELDRLVAQLQRAVLNLRVLPLRHVFNRFPRLVREMVVALGKPARLITEGEATEADKAIVENLFEPLLHVIRNALDHGVETAELRAAAGKPPSATITLRAQRAGDQVVVELEDDGAGIDVQRVKTVAAERGVASAEELAAMSPEDVANLIFAPGFSTADAITSVSGRGVGMDVVRTRIQRLGGEVTIETRAGQGTLVRFTLPFTVMMSRVMTVHAGGELFGIPLEGVVETIRLPADRIVSVGAGQAVVVRERTLPVIDLCEAVGHGRGDLQCTEVNLVIAAAAGQIGALMVERLGDRMDVMLKPLDGLLKSVPGISGATLLGDGRVLLVLDLQALLQ